MCRKSGESDAPMPAAEAVPFESPPSMAVSVTLPRTGVVSGMGVRRGVTLIVGGGFHGKTTLLKALEAGVYNKVRHTKHAPSCTFGTPKGLTLMRYQNCNQSLSFF